MSMTVVMSLDQIITLFVSGRESYNTRFHILIIKLFGRDSPLASVITFEFVEPCILKVPWL